MARIENKAYSGRTNRPESNKGIPGSFYGYLAAGSLLVAAMAVYSGDIAYLTGRIIGGGNGTRHGISFSPTERADYSASSAVTIRPLSPEIEKEFSKGGEPSGVSRLLTK